MTGSQRLWQANEKLTRSEQLKTSKGSCSIMIAASKRYHSTVCTRGMPLMCTHPTTCHQLRCHSTKLQYPDTRPGRAQSCHTAMPLQRTERCAELRSTESTMQHRAAGAVGLLADIGSCAGRSSTDVADGCPTIRTAPPSIARRLVQTLSESTCSCTNF